ncbi:MAG: sugar phosphate isomerase/epimerase family protein [Phreatobacter sp.]|uniref:sugar phosphate isomerase/epimerase family protein n=1 Tax=Phreatobacter sp. TaxID=1966341 RepID=UPI0027348141|nr:sugar phosphate isomerase/epimerase family protein [Phreatobacter sp.]MDP2800358.1 sugar phosphate isomerase/epimerase family protein [Phreatobacter sp.]
MRLSLCNEVLRPFDLVRQCAFAKAVGYDGLEIAPFTLSEAPHRLAAGEVNAMRRTVEDHGLAVTSLHWLLVTPEGLSITSPEAAVRNRTRDVILGLLDLAAGLGALVMVHGSPAQRRPTADQSQDDAWARARDLLADIAPAAEARGLTYCLEPLAPPDNVFIQTVAEAARMVAAIGHPALRTMIDTSAASAHEAEPVADLIRRWVPTGLIGHVQLNDANRRGPGDGEDRFAGVLRTLRDTGYGGDIAIEPFIYEPDGPACAARAAGYVRGLLEALDAAL